MHAIVDEHMCYIKCNTVVHEHMCYYIKCNTGTEEAEDITRQACVVHKINMHTHSRTCTQMHTYTACTSTQANTRTHMHIPTHTYTHTHAHKHTHLVWQQVEQLQDVRSHCCLLSRPPRTVTPFATWPVLGHPHAQVLQQLLAQRVAEPLAQ